MKILVIDDDPLSLSGLKMALEQRGGHCCATFGDPEAALEAWARQPFDAVITDVRMPKLTGLEVLKAIRAKNPHCAVILMTGFRDCQSEATAESYGATAYFLKPLRTEQLLDTLRRIENDLPEPTKNR